MTVISKFMDSFSTELPSEGVLMIPVIEPLPGSDGFSVTVSTPFSLMFVHVTEVLAVVSKIKSGYDSPFSLRASITSFVMSTGIPTAFSSAAVKLSYLSIYP